MPRAGLILYGHFQQPQNVFYSNMWLLKASIQNESRPKAYLHFCEQDVTWSFYSVHKHAHAPAKYLFNCDIGTVHQRKTPTKYSTLTYNTNTPASTPARFSKVISAHQHQHMPGIQQQYALNEHQHLTGVQNQCAASINNSQLLNRTWSTPASTPASYIFINNIQYTIINTSQIFNSNTHYSVNRQEHIEVIDTNIDKYVILE